MRPRLCSDGAASGSAGGPPERSKMLGVSIALCTLVGASKVHANAKGLV